MLVLSRKIGEKIVIGNQEIVITVLNMDREKVRIGFEADTSITIRREEIPPEKLK